MKSLSISEMAVEIARFMRENETCELRGKTKITVVRYATEYVVTRESNLDGFKPMEWLEELGLDSTTPRGAGGFWSRKIFPTYQGTINDALKALAQACAATYLQHLLESNDDLMELSRERFERRAELLAA